MAVMSSGQGDVGFGGKLKPSDGRDVRDGGTRSPFTERKSSALIRWRFRYINILTTSWWRTAKR